MTGTEIPFGLFDGLRGYGTIHDDYVLLDHPLYFHAFIPENPSRKLCHADSRAPPPGGGASFLIVLVRALFPVLGRFCIYSGRFSVRGNEQEPQEKRAHMGFC